VPRPSSPEAVWRRERRGRAHARGLFYYRSGAIDACIAGRLEDGEEFVVAAGAHAAHFPYFHPRARWDDVLLVAGPERLLAAGRRVSTLTIAPGPGPGAILRGRAFDLGLDSLAVARPGAGRVRGLRALRAAPRARRAVAPAAPGLRVRPRRADAGGRGARAGDPLGLAPAAGEPAEPLVVHRLELGPATLERGLVAIGTGAARRLALRQRTQEA